MPQQFRFLFWPFMAPPMKLRVNSQINEKFIKNIKIQLQVKKHQFPAMPFKSIN